MTRIIDGKKLAAQKEKLLAQKITDFRQKSGIIPRLVCFTDGKDPASAIYLRLKKGAADRVGIKMEIVELAEITKLIEKYNRDLATHGIMIQLPFPDAEKAIQAIDPFKDVDGLTGRSKFLPAVVKAIVFLIEDYRYPLKGVNVAVVGQGRLVGRPLVKYLESVGAQVMAANTKTADLKRITLPAEIVVSATGVPDIIQAEMVKPGTLLIDTGSPKAEISPGAALKAGMITPVPGGVGPLTVVSLLENVFLAACGSY